MNRTILNHDEAEYNLAAPAHAPGMARVCQMPHDSVADMAKLLTQIRRLLVAAARFPRILA